MPFIILFYPLLLPIHFILRFHEIEKYTFFIYELVGNKKVIYRH